LETTWWIFTKIGHTDGRFLPTMQLVTFERFNAEGAIIFKIANSACRYFAPKV
jgi:hypothetical protein